MTPHLFRRYLVLTVAVTMLAAVAQPARADQCQHSCLSAKRVCAVQGRTSFIACARSCGPGAAGAACRSACHDALRNSRHTCAATRTDCATSCPSSPSASDGTCAAGCGGAATTCFAAALAAEQTCVEGCAAAGSAAPPSCIEDCVATLRNSGGICLATLQGCLSACHGSVSGTCFDTISMQCTVDPCGPGQPCSQPNEFCSARCASPPPNGTCFDTTTLQCTAQSCSAAQPCASSNQTCVRECPPPPPTGKCFDTTTKQCTDQVCSRGDECPLPHQICTLQCPPPQPTPTPQCGTIPCGGSCTLRSVPFPCPDGETCNSQGGPDVPATLGQCEITAAGDCACVPAPQTPAPTPTPQCSSVPCGGACILPFPCPFGVPCAIDKGGDGLAVMGQCQSDAAGTCACAPVGQTPPPAPTPQCSSVPCDGDCVIAPPCPPGSACPKIATRLGRCAVVDATAGCECVPLSPAPTPPPTPTPRQQCDTVPCGGPCVSRPPCTPGMACPDFVIKGECQADATGACLCVPAPTPTPVCATDADCDDGDACTADRCDDGRCAHVCICLSADGAHRCCGGPADLCIRPCGADAAGTCGGSCPSGATCDALPDAQGCGCVAGVGGPCGGNILGPPPVCAAGLTCVQPLPDVTGVCEAANCVPFFASGCSQTPDCCEPCGNGRRPPCAVCISGTCVGAP